MSTNKMIVHVVSLRAGDKWLVSCLGVLHLSKGLFYRVVPADQGFGNTGEPPGSPTAEYAGVFRFRLWWCGAWVEVLVDDRLPAILGRLAFVQSRHSDQFWPALLEKAYAKWVQSIHTYSEKCLNWSVHAYLSIFASWRELNREGKKLMEMQISIGFIIRSYANLRKAFDIARKNTSGILHTQNGTHSSFHKIIRLFVLSKHLGSP